LSLNSLNCLLVAMHLPGTLGPIASPDVRPAARHPGRYLEFCG
jgi:hypothetical protein